MTNRFDPEYRIGINAAKKDIYGPAMFFLRSSAEKGNSDSQNDLGVCYEKQHQYEKAMFWYKTAASNGSEMALCNIGKLYERGFGVEQDYDAAIKYYKKAVRKKFSYAYYLLGFMYNEGLGVEKNESKAFNYWLLGSKTKNHDYEMRNNFQVGYCYEYGIGTQIDYKKALTYYNKVAGTNHRVAKYNAGLAYLYGRGTEVDVEKALDLLCDSAQSGYVDAMKALADVYYEGSQIEQNPDVCVYWIRVGADRNDPYCLLKLAEFALRGECMERDLDEAFSVLKHFLKACPNPDQEYVEIYRDLKKYYKNQSFWDALDNYKSNLSQEGGN